ncbi:MAG: hypothetical protein DRK00_08575, partial [Thermoprotei archaeon]
SEKLEYVGIIIGESGQLRDLYRRLKAKYWRLHCKKLPESLGRSLAASLLEGNATFICVCTRMSEVVREVAATLLARGVRTPRKAIRLRGERALGRYLAGLLLKHSVERVYADKELIPLLVDVGIMATPGFASELADPVAWANYKRLSIESLEEVDISEYLIEAAVKKA